MNMNDYTHPAQSTPATTSWNRLPWTDFNTPQRSGSMNFYEDLTEDDQLNEPQYPTQERLHFEEAIGEVPRPEDQFYRGEADYVYEDEDIIMEDEETQDMDDEDLAMSDLMGNQMMPQRDQQYLPMTSHPSRSVDPNSRDPRTTNDYQYESERRGDPTSRDDQRTAPTSEDGHLSQLLVDAGMHPNEVSQMNTMEKVQALQQRLSSSPNHPVDHFHHHPQSNDARRGGARRHHQSAANVSYPSQGGSSRRTRAPRPPTPRGGGRFFGTSRGRGGGRGNGRPQARQAGRWDFHQFHPQAQDAPAPLAVRMPPSVGMNSTGMHNVSGSRLENGRGGSLNIGSGTSSSGGNRVSL